MEAVQLVLPTFATLALGTALLMPLRDDRRGRRATLGGVEPLRPEFRVIRPRGDPEAVGEHTLQSNDFCSEHIRTDTDRAIGHGVGSDIVVGDSADCGRDAHVESAASTIPQASQALQNIDDSPALNDVGDTTPSARSTSVSKLLERLCAILSGKSTLASRSADASETNVPPVVRDRIGETTIERSFADELSRLLTPDVNANADMRPAELPIAISPTTSSTSVAEHSLAPRTPIAFELLNIAASKPSLESEVAPQAESIPAAVIARIRSGGDRVVPLTRLPLRPQSGTVTWPAELDPPCSPVSSAERHALLATFLREPAKANANVLEIAYAQEDRAGRFLALRALMQTKPTLRTRSTFIEALRAGSDDERAFTLDALAVHGEREDYVPALRDRVDAIAAQAALAYVALDSQAAYREALAPHLDAARIESILILLAGVIE